MTILAAGLLVAGRADAYPLLQLDILGGYYDQATQTVIADGQEFTLVALLSPRADASPADIAAFLADTYYISAALSPDPGPAHTQVGSFRWNGTNYDVTGDMTYGTPPLEDLSADLDMGDMQDHGIYPTHFREFSFRFDENNRTIGYDTADHRGGLMPTTETANVSYFATFNIQTSIAAPNVLHFDLYSSFVNKCRNEGLCDMDEDIEYWAPPRNDAESQRVAEPQSMLVMSAGLLLACRLLRRPKQN